MPTPKEIAEARRAQVARLGDKGNERYQRAESLQGVKRTGGEAIKLRIEEHKMVGNHSFDLFPTPEKLAADMVSMAGVVPGMKVLEPSAGTGRIAKAVRAVGVQPLCVEFANSAQEFLLKQGFTVICKDFLETSPEILGMFDAVLMNPPFSNLADVDHVMHAYNFLADGGTLIAIMSESPFHQQRGKAQTFRTWLEGKGSSEKLPDGTFKESGTNVNSRLVTIFKQ